MQQRGRAQRKSIATAEVERPGELVGNHRDAGRVRISIALEFVRLHGQLAKSLDRVQLVAVKRVYCRHFSFRCKYYSRSTQIPQTRKERPCCFVLRISRQSAFSFALCAPAQSQRV